MIVGTAGHHAVAPVDEAVGHGPRIGDHALLVLLEFRRCRLLEAHGFCSDHVHQRAALGAGEQRGVELFLKRWVGVGENDATARAG